MPVSREELIALRIRAHGLDGSLGADPVRAVQRMLAVQAQDLTAATWALGVRALGSTLAEVGSALSSGRVVRSWPLRGTLHLVAAEDLRWLLALSALRMTAAARPRLERMGLDARVLALARDAAAEALAGGVALTRREFVEILDRRGVPTDAGLGYQVIYFLAQSGLICWGPPAGTQQRLVLVDDWIPAAEDPLVDGQDRVALLGRLALRYLGGHGPATIADLQWWAKLTLRDARAAIQSAGSDLVELDGQGESFWVTRSLMDGAGEPVHDASAASLPGVEGVAQAVLLPGFDELILGAGYRRIVIDPEHEHILVPSGNGIFRPSILTRRGLAGTWRRVGKTPAVHGSPEAWSLEADLLPVGPALRSEDLARSSRRYADFFRLPAPAWTTVRRVGEHGN